MEDDIYGYSLFNHVEDSSLQKRNRVMTLANIIEDNLFKGTVTEHGQYIFGEYQRSIDWDNVEADVITELQARGLLGAV